MVWEISSGIETNWIYQRDLERKRWRRTWHVEIQQEDPSENYAPTLGWSLKLFLGGRLFLDDE